MKLKRRDFLKSIVPALIGGRKVVEDLLREPAEEPEPEETMRVDTPTGVTASCYPGYPPLPLSYGPIYYDGRPLEEVDSEYIAVHFEKAFWEGIVR